MAKQSKFVIEKAEKKKQKLKIGLEGTSGSGKTYAALLIASGLAEKTSDKICLIDTENRSASLYGDLFEFDTLPMEAPFSPENFIEAIEYAESQGYGIIIIDSASHEWMGKGGILDLMDKMGGRATGWKELTPRHNKFVDKLLHCQSHLIITLRTKTEYDYDNSGGKLKVTKLGTKAVQREGLDYEMTTVLRLNQEHLASADKDRTGIFVGKSFTPSKETGYEIYNWLTSGKEDVPTEEDIEEYKTLISGYPEERIKVATAALVGMTGTKIRSTINKIKMAQLAVPK